jgi:DNA-binding Lrp family transcriptional regulator
MERLILNKIEFNILSTLARDCRTYYNSIGLQIGLTSKSVKARVKNMIRTGVTSGPRFLKYKLWTMINYVN